MKQCFFAISFLLLGTIASAQQKPKTAVTNISALQKILGGTGLPFKMANDSLAAIPYGGENIPSYQVIVQKVSDLYIIYTNLTEAMPGKIGETKYKYLLQQNNHFDVVKIGLSEDDNTVYLRADIYRTTATTALLKRIIAQVANVANIIGGELK